MRQNLLVVAFLCFFVSMAGCSTQKASLAPKTTSDAVIDVAVVSAHYCKTISDQNGSDFKSCLKQQLSSAIAQLQRYEACVSAIGCEPQVRQ